MKGFLILAAWLGFSGLAYADCEVAGNGANRCVSVTLEDFAFNASYAQVKTSGDETLLSDCVPVQSTKLRLLTSDAGFEEMFAMLMTAYIQGTVLSVYTTTDGGTCMITSVTFG